MKRINVFAELNCKELMAATQVILNKYGYFLVGKREKDAMIIHAIHCDKDQLRIEKEGMECFIYYNKKACYFRGLSLLLQRMSEENFVIEETVHFNSNGIMLDCARNGVPGIETLKKYIEWLSEFGMNRLYLYVEDVLELKEYPHWGYLRGRYTEEEMREVDRYAKDFGVALIPCIQTLAHLRSALKQPMFAAYKDIDDILLIDSDESKKLLVSLLKTVSNCFSSEIVHLGMDEAANLGRGKFLDRNGYVPPASIMKKHLEWLSDECKKCNLQPIIWSDMYLRLNFGVEDYYSVPENAEPHNADNLSKEITLCYWDYYNETEAFYKKYLNVHKKLGNPMIFAGGAWTWNGIAPNVSKALRTTKDALRACIAENVKDVFCTVWMDNGAETPWDTCLPIMVWYGEYGFGNEPDEERVKTRFEQCCHKSYELYALLDAFDNRSNPLNGYLGELNNKYADNPSKIVFYEDPLMGQFAKTINEKSLKEHFGKIRNRLNNIGTDDEILRYYALLAEILWRKADIGDSIKKAYGEKNLEELNALCNVLDEIVKLTEQLSVMRQKIWMQDNKPFGYEILDIRFGGVIARAKSAIVRIQELIHGTTNEIPELEEEILPVKTPEMIEKEVLHGFYVWDKIISNCNIDGI